MYVIEKEDAVHSLTVYSAVNNVQNMYCSKLTLFDI